MSADGGGRSSGRGRQRTRRLGLRRTEAEFESWRREAERDGRTLGGWVRWRVDLLITRLLCYSRLAWQQTNWST